MYWAAAGIGGLLGIRWVRGAEREDGIPWPLRRVHRFNELVSRTLLGTGGLAPSFAREASSPPRVNGLVGLAEPINIAAWRLRVFGPDADDVAPAARKPLAVLTLDDVRALPRHEMTVEFKCVEGWSQVIHYGGARLSDLAARYPSVAGCGFVGMETPDRSYYVGLDIESALHPQTLLAYEMDGRPLEPENGAPLRLAIPVKYGYKHIKRIGQIRFSQRRPADYWSEYGYDWYAGH